MVNSEVRTLLLVAIFPLSRIYSMGLNSNHFLTLISTGHRTLNNFGEHKSNIWTSEHGFSKKIQEHCNIEHPSNGILCEHQTSVMLSSENRTFQCSKISEHLNIHTFEHLDIREHSNMNVRLLVDSDSHQFQKIWFPPKSDFPQPWKISKKNIERLLIHDQFGCLFI